MIYLMSDIHGCYEEYKELLEKINFSDEDELYVLGDVVDRGPEPIKVLQDMMMRPNVYPILGNHDYMALRVLKKFNVEITGENVESHLSQKDIMDYIYWQDDGGKTTSEKFQKLSREEKEDILAYLEEFSLYEDIFLDGKRYVCVHADLHNFSETKDLEDYELSDFIFHRADYKTRYFNDFDTYLVTGHTPTMVLNDDKQAKVHESNGHIAIDCGCVYGFRLAAYCLNNGKITYVERKNIIPGTQ